MAGAAMAQSATKAANVVASRWAMMFSLCYCSCFIVAMAHWSYHRRTGPDRHTTLSYPIPQFEPDSSMDDSARTHRPSASSSGVVDVLVPVALNQAYSYRVPRGLN